jgi:hypothetical protein
VAARSKAKVYGHSPAAIVGFPTEAIGFFLLEKSTACSTIRYKRHKRRLKVQYQDNEAQDTAKKKPPPEAWMFVCCVLSGLCNGLITRPE